MPTRQDVRVPVPQIWYEAQRFPERGRIDGSGIYRHPPPSTQRMLHQGCGEVTAEAEAAKSRTDIETPHAESIRRHRVDGEPADACQLTRRIRREQPFLVPGEAH